MSISPEPLSDTELGLVGLKAGALVCNGVHEHVWTGWCDHLARFVMNNQDAELLHAGVTFDCPVFPSAKIFVQVTIGDPIVTGAGLMWMSFTPDIGRQRKHPLGFWNPGEGCWSIRTVIVDYLKSQLDPNETFGSGRILSKCPASASHTMKRARQMKEMSSKDANWKAACLWNIVMEKACTICLEADSSDPDNYGLGAAVPRPSATTPLPF